MTDLEKQPYEALRLLVKEVMLSGNGNAHDYGWPLANRAAAEAIDAYEIAREHETAPGAEAARP